MPPQDRALKLSCAEAFGWDSDLVKEARREFSKHSYNFITEGTCNLSEIFKQKAMSAELLGTSTYNIQASWMGPEELKQVNYALRSLPKGLNFLSEVPPSESPKVMGLVEMHNPDTLQHFSGVIHCPWCGKEGQNEGTVVNHLWTEHYRLGLVCGWCHDCLSTMVNTLHCHGQQDCCQPREKNPNESVLSEWSPEEANPSQPGISTRRPGQNGLHCVALSAIPLPTITALEEDQQRRHHPSSCTTPHLFSHKTQLGSHLLPLKMKFKTKTSKLSMKTVNNIGS